MAELALLDWLVVAFFLTAFVFIGIRFRGNAGKGLSDFFLGGRNLPWYVAGVSMVATTFAADTPLWVTEKIAQHGISGNWLWWNMLIGGMLTTFFFARLWRRAEIVTELELLELRYHGRWAQWLRGVKSVYLGLFLNVIIIGWVNVALISILEVFFGLDAQTAFWAVAGIMILVAIYSSVAGLLGIAITDFAQFIIAMGGCIILAIFVLDAPEVGGISGLKAKLPEWRLDFFPKVGVGEGVSMAFSLTTGAFLSYIFLQWWASWYPGNEPGGGGYISQRMMSVRKEKDAVYASLFFQIAHYALRPWPWIIVGLCALVLYPDLPIEESKKGFVYAMRDYLPVGLKGLLLVGFISAYMSTISTQLNWGASYLTNDLYARFVKPAAKFKSSEEADTHYVKAGRLFTVLIMAVGLFATTQIDMIDEAAQFLIGSGAGLGMVLILRWYWWRINAWSEISATVAPLLGYAIGYYLLPQHAPDWFEAQNGPFIFTVAFTTVVWISVTFLTPATPENVLRNFVARVRPSGLWGKYQQSGHKSTSGYLLLAWIFGVLMTYSILFSLGYGIFQEWTSTAIWGAGAVIGLVGMRWSMQRGMPD